MKNKELTIILRWIAVLPAAVLGALAGNLIGLINGGGSEDGVIDIVFVITRNVLVGGGFVAAGWLTAPRYKNIVKIVLATIVGCLCAFSIFLTELVNKVGGDWVFYLGIIATIAGAIFACKYFEDDDTK